MNLSPSLLSLSFIQNRGSAIAKIVGGNAARLPNFCDRVTMYVFEEMIEGKKLTEIINEQHENVKYLPGHKLPANVVRILLQTLIVKQHKCNQVREIDKVPH